MCIHTLLLCSGVGLVWLFCSYLDEDDKENIESRVRELEEELAQAKKNGVH